MADILGHGTMNARSCFCAVALLCVSLFPARETLAEYAAAPPKAQQTRSPLPAPTPSPTEAVKRDAAPASPTPSPSATPTPRLGTATVERTRGESAASGEWTAKEVATILAGLGALCGAIVAAFAIRSNGNSSRSTTIQKANEAELEALQSKLDNFYGPYLQLSNTNKLIASDVKSRQPAGADMRVLLILLDPEWKQKFKAGEVALIEEILKIDEKLLDLIQEKSGLVSSVVQPYLWRAAAHFRIMKLAAGKMLDNDPERYGHYVYPKQLDDVIELEIGRIRERMEKIQTNPMVLHPPAADLTIPARLKLDDWPGPARDVRAMAEISLSVPRTSSAP